jgi:hypothetical protein
LRVVTSPDDTLFAFYKAQKVHSLWQICNFVRVFLLRRSKKRQGTENDSQKLGLKLFSFLVAFVGACL